MGLTRATFPSLGGKNVETAEERFLSLVSDNSGALADIKRSQCSDEELEGKIWTL